MIYTSKDCPRLVSDNLRFPLSTDKFIFYTSNFWEKVCDEWFQMDVITYTAQPTTIETPKLRRVIVGCPKSFDNFPTNRKTVRFHPKMHVKLYIGYNCLGKVKSAYVGSLNLCRPSIHNMMVKVTDKQELKLLREYFNTVWEQL